jgi:hypothetical protein
VSPEGERGWSSLPQLVRPAQPQRRIVATRPGGVIVHQGEESTVTTVRV